MQGWRNGVNMDDVIIHVVYGVLAPPRGDKMVHYRRPTMGATT